MYLGRLKKIGIKQTKLNRSKTNPNGIRALANMPNSIFYSGAGKKLNGIDQYIDCGTWEDLKYTGDKSNFTFLFTISKESSGTILSTGNTGITLSILNNDISVKSNNTTFSFPLQEEYERVVVAFSSNLFTIYLKGKKILEVPFALANITFSATENLSLFAYRLTSSFMQGVLKDFVFIGRTLNAKEISFDFKNIEESYSNLIKDKECVFASTMANKGNYIINDVAYALGENIHPNKEFYTTEYFTGESADISVEKGNLVVRGNSTIPRNQKASIRATNFLQDNMQTDFYYVEFEITESSNTTGLITSNAKFLDTSLSYYYPAKVGKYKKIIKGNILYLSYHAGTSVGAKGKFKNPIFKKVKGIIPITSATGDSADINNIEVGMQKCLFKQNEIGAFLRPNIEQDLLNFDGISYVDTGVVLGEEFSIKLIQDFNAEDLQIDWRLNGTSTAGVRIGKQKNSNGIFIQLFDSYFRISTRKNGKNHIFLTYKNKVANLYWEGELIATKTDLEKTTENRSFLLGTVYGYYYNLKDNAVVEFTKKELTQKQIKEIYIQDFNKGLLDD